MAKKPGLFRKIASWFGNRKSPADSAPFAADISAQEALRRAPAWLLRPLPANFAVDPGLESEIDELRKSLPQSIFALGQKLSSVRDFAEYDSAANLAASFVWLARDQFRRADAGRVRSLLLQFAIEHLPPTARDRVVRELAKDPDPQVRRKTRRYIERGRLREVALPAEPEGDWDATGWLHGVERNRIFGHTTGHRVQTRLGLPELNSVGELRELLEIRSERQLGYFLLATDADGGPYHRFTIPKRDGHPREICAPRPQLRWVQQQILRRILNHVPLHPAAHAFVSGRSTVTNATPHLRAAVVLKFDLRDFFPTIAYFRIVGLFASFGYHLEHPRFSRDDDSRQLAPTLARLCSYTPTTQVVGAGYLPQGAPTSPAISNLICRGLDARLHGLAAGLDGVYTRYADDMTFSFRTEPANLGRLRWWVNQICHQEGFFVNESKFRVIRRGQRQMVTGLVVNDELRVPRRERRRFRAILHNCRLHGLESQANGNPGFAAYLRGFASYIHMVHPEEGRELLQQVSELLGPDEVP